MPRFFTLGFASVATWLLAIVLHCNAVSADQRVPFSIFYGGAEVGTFAITTSADGNQKKLESSMDLRAAFGPITLHRMLQTTREIWENGKLVHLDARTAENGDETMVAARYQAGDLVVDGPNGSSVARGPVGTLSSLIMGAMSGQFIDPKNGLLLPIVVEQKSSPPRPGMNFSGKPVKGFSISGGVTGEVWRDPDGVFLIVVQSDGVELEFRRPSKDAAGSAEPETRVISMSSLFPGTMHPERR